MPRRGGAPGDIVEIPLARGGRAYAQLLTDPYVAIYDVAEQPTDLAELDGAPVAFVIAVNHQPTRTGRWRVVGSLPATCTAVPIPEFFIQDWIDPNNCRIVDVNGTIRSATPEECMGIEPAITWSAENVEERIEDTRAGRPNRQLEDLALRTP